MARPSPAMTRVGLKAQLLAKGDFMFVPPFIPHLEANMSTSEELWWLACRTPENIVVNLPDVDDALLAGYRRA
jgi:uncharacterized RmlC-like cupin family protein